MKKKRIKVLYTIPNFDTAGCCKVVYDILDKIDKTEYDVEVMVKHNRGKLFKEVQKLNVPIHIYNYEASYYPLWSLPIRVLRIAFFLKKLNVDIIHSWHWSSDFTEPLAARLAGIKYVYTKKNMSWGNKAWKIRSRLSTSIVTINSSMKTSFFKNYNNIELIPIGIDTSYYKPKERKGQIDDIRTATDTFVVITVANMVPVKGIEYLIRSFVKVENRTEKKMKLLLVGSVQNEYAKKLKKESKYSNNIYFLGKKMDVRPYLAESDLFVIPTLNIGRKEAQGVAPLEAMAMGIPVIATNLEGLSEVMTGFEDNLVEPANVDDLAKKIEGHIMSDKPEQQPKPLGFLKRYQLEKMIESYELLYKKI